MKLYERRTVHYYLAIICVVLGLVPAKSGVAGPDVFTIAVIPDTQNYVDYRQQKAQGFPVDGSALFLEQMRYIVERAKSNGGDIVFALSLGDMKQHFSLDIDVDHKARGFLSVPNAAFAYYEGPTPQAREEEMPLIVRGYRLLDGALPFLVVPGNHDYDAFWTDATHPAQPGKAGTSALIHYTGLNDFCSAFSSQSPFFKGKPWYVGSHDCGADSAQIFEAGGYRFLVIGLQYEPPDASLAWAQSIIDKYRGLPTIISTHYFLAPNGRRADEVFDDPERNSPVEMWSKFIRKNDQIFMVLSGHRCTQAYSVDRNDRRHDVQQVLSDFQCRWQVAKDAGLKTYGVGLGDGWLRLMEFDLLGDAPTIRVRTYSTHYRAFSTDLPQYAEWYKAAERPGYTDEEFLAEDDFVISLTDFRDRFGAPRSGSR